MREVPLGDSLYFKGRAENETELNGTRPGSGQFWRNKSLHSFRRVTDQAIPGFLSWVAAGQGSTEEDPLCWAGGPRNFERSRWARERSIPSVGRERSLGFDAQGPRRR